VNDPDQLLAWLRDDAPQERMSGYDDGPVRPEGSAADLTGGLVNLGFFTAALRRSAWVWTLTAVVGLLLGSALFVKFPPAYHATASVLLVDSTSQNPAVEVLTDTSLAESEPVAAHVVRELKLPQTVESFQANYTVATLTDTVLTFNVGAKSSAESVQRAAALAAAFLQYRAQYEKNQQKQLFAQLDPQYNAAQQRLKVLQSDASRLPTTPTTPAEKAEYDHLQSQITQQQLIMQTVTTTRQATITNTDAMVTGSFVLDPAAPVKRSKIKTPMLYIGGGLFGGLVLGMAIVIFPALLSRRLRRRDDVAIAVGAPVALSVGPLRRRRWPPASPRQAAKRKLDRRRVVAYLRTAVSQGAVSQGAVPQGSRGPASLAVVAVDDPPVVAQAVVSLAASSAAEGKRVVVADLSGGAYLARMLDVTEPGMHRVNQDGVALLVVLPESDDIAPAGPLPARTSPAAPAQGDSPLTAACSAADLLLTLAVLDPAAGADHLGTWATNAVAVVTAGQSSAERIHSIGEMIRLGGARLDSVVLLGTDKSDESLGVVAEQPVAQQAQPPGLTNGSNGGRRGRHGVQGRPESVDPII
jgi:capsular polysaccharide biosynthesis protein